MGRGERSLFPPSHLLTFPPFREAREAGVFVCREGRFSCPAARGGAVRRDAMRRTGRDEVSGPDAAFPTQSPPGDSPRPPVFVVARKRQTFKLSNLPCRRRSWSRVCALPQKPVSANSLSFRVQTGIALCPDGVASVTKRRGVCDHKKELASFQHSSCVNSIVFWRQFYRVLTPKLMTVHRRKRFCSQAESDWP